MDDVIAGGFFDITLRMRWILVRIWINHSKRVEAKYTGNYETRAQRTSVTMSDCHHFVAYLRALPSGYIKRNHALSLSLLISMTQFTLTCLVQSFFNSPGTEQR